MTPQNTLRERHYKKEAEAEQQELANGAAWTQTEMVLLQNTRSSVLCQTSLCITASLWAADLIQARKWFAFSKLFKLYEFPTAHKSQISAFYKVKIFYLFEIGHLQDKI